MFCRVGAGSASVVVNQDKPGVDRVPGVFASPAEWSERFAAAHVHVQWDPERSLRGRTLPHSGIQIGVSRHLIRAFTDEWIVGIEDYTPRVRKIYDLLQSGHTDRTRRHRPPERVYPVNSDVARLLIGEE